MCLGYSHPIAPYLLHYIGDSLHIIMKTPMLLFLSLRSLKCLPGELAGALTAALCWLVPFVQTLHSVAVNRPLFLLFHFTYPTICFPLSSI